MVSEPKNVTLLMSGLKTKDIRRAKKLSSMLYFLFSFYVARVKIITPRNVNPVYIVLAYQ